MILCEKSLATQEFSSTAWLVEGGSADEGWLGWRDGQLTFTDHAGNVVFTATADAVDIAFPWYYWGQCRLRLLGETFRIAFSPPGKLADVAFRMQGLSIPELDQLVGSDGHPDGRLLGVVWRRLLVD